LTKLSEIERCVNHEKDIAELQKDLNEVSAKFTRILNGNGQAGLCKEVSEMQKEFYAEKKMTRLYMGAIVMMNCAIIGMLVKLIFFK